MASVRELIRGEYEMLKEQREILSDLGVDVRKQQIVIRKTRDRIAELQAKQSDPLAKPITVDWRHAYEFEGESGYDYVILTEDNSTDEELDEWFDDFVAYPPINSPYDCTGKRFTWGKHIQRTPAGIVVIHRWSLDI